MVKGKVEYRKMREREGMDRQGVEFVVVESGEGKWSRDEGRYE